MSRDVVGLSKDKIAVALAKEKDGYYSRTSLVSFWGRTSPLLSLLWGYLVSSQLAQQVCVEPRIQHPPGVPQVEAPEVKGCIVLVLDTYWHALTG